MLLASKLHRLKVSLIAANLDREHLTPIFTTGLVLKAGGIEPVATEVFCRKVEVLLEHVFHAPARVSAEAIGEILTGKKFKTEDEAVAYCGVQYLLELDTIKSGHELMAMLFKLPKEYGCLKEVLYEAAKKSCSKTTYEKIQIVLEMYDLNISGMLQQQADAEWALMQAAGKHSLQRYPAYFLYYRCEFMGKDPTWQQFNAWNWLEKHDPHTATHLFNKLLETMREVVPKAAGIIPAYRLIIKDEAVDCAKGIAAAFHRPISPLEMAERIRYSSVLRCHDKQGICQSL